MSLLTKYSTSAERARGCVWVDRFESQAQVERNGGTVTGTPTFSARDGVTLDGTNDYLTYGLMGHEVRSSMTWQIEFTPDFAYDEDVTRNIAEAANAGGTAGHSIFKRDNAQNNTLSIYMKSTLIAQIPSATYGPHWRQGQRNVLVVSSATGDTDAWLNGTRILTNDASGWADMTAGWIYVGSNRNGANPFDGTIHRVQVYNQKLSDHECEQISSGTVYSYPQGTVWDFTVAHGLSDASGANTLTAYNAPTKLAAHGYEFDGVNQYLQGAIATSISNQDPISFVFEFTPHFAVDTADRPYFFRVDEGGPVHASLVCYNAGDYYLYLGALTFIASFTSAEAAPAFRRNQRNVIVVSATSGDSSLWWNGIELISNDNTVWTPQTDVDRLTFASHPDAGGFYFDGQIHSFHAIPALLSRMQAIDITQRLMKQANRV